MTFYFPNQWLYNSRGQTIDIQKLFEWINELYFLTFFVPSQELTLFKIILSPAGMI